LFLLLLLLLLLLTPAVEDRDEGDVDDVDGSLLIERGGRAALGEDGRGFNATPRPASLAGCVVGADETGPGTPVL
jgi:hypothetical protein